MPFRDVHISRRRLLMSGAAASMLAAAPRIGHAQDAPIRIGFLLPMSGGAKFFGDSVKIGIDIAVEEINAAGGVNGRMVEAVIRDDKASATEAVGAFRDLAGQGVNLMAGAVFTPLGLGVVPLLPEAKSLFISVAAVGMALTHQAYTPWYFRGSPNAYMMYRGQALRAARANPEITTWGVVSFNSAGSLDVVNFLAHGIREQYKSVADADVTILDPILLAPDQTDFRGAISQLMNSPAQGLICGVTGGGAISLYSQGHSLGWQPKIQMIQDSGIEIEIGKALGRRTPTNINSTIMWYHGAHPDNEMNTTLFDGYVAKAGNELPSGYVERGYTTVHTYCAAIAAAGTDDPETLIEVMEETEFQSPKGPFRFRKEDHQYVGEVGNIRLDPAENEAGWQISDYFAAPGTDLVEPASPGEEFTL